MVVSATSEHWRNDAWANDFSSGILLLNDVQCILPLRRTGEKDASPPVEKRQDIDGGSRLLREGIAVFNSAGCSMYGWMRSYQTVTTSHMRQPE